MFIEGCINDGTINSISQLATLHHVYKILLLMGIGVFTYNKLDRNQINISAKKLIIWKIMIMLKS